MKKNILYKAFIGHILIILVLAFLILSFSFVIIRNYYIDILEKGLIKESVILSPQIVDLFTSKKYKSLDFLVKNIGKSIDTRITVIDLNGVVVADSDKDPKTMENHKTRPEIMQAINGNIGKSLRFSKTLSEKMLYVAIPMRKDGKIIGILRLSLFLSDINHLLNDLRERILIIVLIVLCFSIIIAFIFSKNLTKPIKQLVDASKNVAKGEFNAKVFLNTNDELRELADSFNSMTEDIKNLFLKLAQQKEELNNIISSVQAGIMMLDGSGKVLIVNKGFKDILKNDVIDNRYYWEIFKEPEFKEFIGKVIDEKKNIIEEVKVNQRIYLSSITFVPLNNNIIFIFHDITDIKNLENMKKDFITNVSHELKTPLTAIKGFIETIESESLDIESKHYLEIINRHTNRLINIVNDLLLLSSLEEKENELKLEKVELNSLLKDTIKIFCQKLKDKHVKISFNDNNTLYIYGDSFKLEQVFINLIDNAVKYTDKGEIKISTWQIKDEIEIEISDTGIGIPEDKINRIFERFFVVDSSRSKAIEGTGLGLSIVKHIVLIHKGKIDIESRLGVGTKVTVTLPSNLS